MAIDSLKLMKQTVATQLGQGLRRGAATSGTSFAETLESLKLLESQSADRDSELAKMAVKVQMAHFHLLQGLLLEDGEGTDDSGLFSLLQPAPISRPLPTTSQKIDKLYAHLEPKLMEPETSRCTDIERMIDRIADQVSLAPELIRSVVATESDFRSDAVSPVGAQGLMQLMPETAKELGVADSFDPQQNLLGGSRYLKQLLDKYDGDLDKALAAYNWGQGNVDRHGLEKMPRETREYLAKVKAGLNKIEI